MFRAKISNFFEKINMFQYSSKFSRRGSSRTYTKQTKACKMIVFGLSFLLATQLHGTGNNYVTIRSYFTCIFHKIKPLNFPISSWFEKFDLKISVVASRIERTKKSQILITIRSSDGQTSQNECIFTCFQLAENQASGLVLHAFSK